MKSDDMYVGFTRRVSSLLSTVTAVSSGRRFAPTVVVFSHPRFPSEGADKKRKLLCRVTTSRGSTGLARRVNQYGSRSGASSSGSPAQSFVRAYSSDKTNVCSESGRKMARDPASDQLLDYKKNLKVTQWP